ncbi:hypothetical protein [Flexithrix dorotheae]|uniref:hypothetical protein n=1 Tax=Flexithrix dorotheae TaxID=70993 RepID=UPI0003698111|nr:hypothetical protein [Flexithrix dorotheae]
MSEDNDDSKDLLPFKRPRKKNLDDDDIPLGKGKVVQPKKKEKKQVDVPKRHTFFVNPDLLEQLKDLVYTRKYTQGDIEANQSTIINEALEKYLNEYKGEIKSRPQFIRDIEEKKSKRPNSKK